jgi:hypothetical protein
MDRNRRFVFLTAKGTTEKERQRKREIKRWVLAQHSVFNVLLKLTSDELHHHKKKNPTKIPLLDHFLPPYEYYLLRLRLVQGGGWSI